MPCKVYFNEKGEVFYVEPLRVGLFFIPEGREIERIDLNNPSEPVAILKEPAPQVVEAEEIQPDQGQEA